MNLFHRRYVVACSRRNNIDPYDIEKYQFRLVDQGLKQWVADPFPFEYNGELYIFAEIMRYKDYQGSIGYTKLVNGKFTEWRVIIEEPYHLSFPNIFEHDGKIYICPESGESKNIYLYKCEVFPDKWVKDRVICEGESYADTVFFDSGISKFGITCLWNGVEEHELKMFKTDNFFNAEFSNGDINTEHFWMSRPAGKFFYSKKENKVLGVSQICKNRYGEGMAIKEVDIKWPSYRERILKKIYPKDLRIRNAKKYIGTHTYNVSKNYAVIDLVYSSINFVDLYYRAKRKIHKVMSQSKKRRIGF